MREAQTRPKALSLFGMYILVLSSLPSGHYFQSSYMRARNLLGLGCNAMNCYDQDFDAAPRRGKKISAFYAQNKRHNSSSSSSLHFAEKEKEKVFFHAVATQAALVYTSSCEEELCIPLMAPRWHTKK